MQFLFYALKIWSASPRLSDEWTILQLSEYAHLSILAELIRFYVSLVDLWIDIL